MRLPAAAVLALVLAVPAEARAPSRLLVEATEFRFALSRTTVKAGPAVIQLAIRGEDPHDLRIARASIPETLPGEVGEWSGRLKPGRYKVYCSLPGHERAGMRAYLTVR
jgi:plastocyanin